MSATMHYHRAKKYLADAATRRYNLDRALRDGPEGQDVRIEATQEEIRQDLAFALVHATLATVK